MTEPQDEDHKAIWDAIHSQTDAIGSLRREISVNGYAEILREIARRYEARRVFWSFFKRPKQMLAKGFWIVLGGAAVAIATHLIK